MYVVFLKLEEYEKKTKTVFSPVLYRSRCSNGAGTGARHGDGRERRTGYRSFGSGKRHDGRYCDGYGREVCFARGAEFGKNIDDLVYRNGYPGSGDCSQPSSCFER